MIKSLENVGKIPPFGNYFIGSDSHHKKSIGILYLEKQNKTIERLFYSLKVVSISSYVISRNDYIENMGKYDIF